MLRDLRHSALSSSLSRPGRVSWLMDFRLHLPPTPRCLPLPLWIFFLPTVVSSLLPTPVVLADFKVDDTHLLGP